MWIELAKDGGLVPGLAISFLRSTHMSKHVYFAGAGNMPFLKMYMKKSRTFLPWLLPSIIVPFRLKRYMRKN